jgi:uncharacterized protein (TIGR01777 family)
MLPAFKLFVGGPLGSGDQYFPWIHVRDVCRGINFAIENETLEGPFNLSAPNPVTMNQFADALADKLNRPSLFRVPEFVLEFIFADAAGPVLSSVRLQPKKIQQHGFEFKYKHLDEALRDIF